MENCGGVLVTRQVLVSSASVCGLVESVRMRIMQFGRSIVIFARVQDHLRLFHNPVSSLSLKKTHLCSKIATKSAFNSTSKSSAITNPHFYHKLSTIGYVLFLLSIVLCVVMYTYQPTLRLKKIIIIAKNYQIPRPYLYLSNNAYLL